MNDKSRQFIFVAMPVFIVAFFVLALTIICPWRWVTALVQIPAWGALIYWQYICRDYYELLDL